MHGGGNSFRLNVTVKNIFRLKSSSSKISLRAILNVLWLLVTSHIRQIPLHTHALKDQNGLWRTKTKSKSLRFLEGRALENMPKSSNLGYRFWLGTLSLLKDFCINMDTSLSEIRCKYDQKYFFFLFSWHSAQRHFFEGLSSDQ